MTTGEKLRAAMKQADMTEYQLAQRMWVSPAYIIAVMRDKTEIDGPTRGKIEQILGMEHGALKPTEEIHPDDYDEKRHSGLIEE